MMNHPWVIEQARAIGGRLAKQKQVDESLMLVKLYEDFTGREPSDMVLRNLKRACERTREVLKAEAGNAATDELWTDMALLLINSNDWLYLD
jgi:hypothetical protein